MADVRWWEQETPIGTITVAVSDSGVRAIGLPGEALDDLREQGVPERDEEVAGRIDEWFAGTRRDLDLPLDLTGLEGFRRTVLETLTADVGWGETVSYGELAELAGRPGAARAVGNVMAGNPIPLVIPCHRVLAAGGRIGGYGASRTYLGGREMKRALLAREGVNPRG